VPGLRGLRRLAGLEAAQARPETSRAALTLRNDTTGE